MTFRLRISLRLKIRIKSTSVVYRLGLLASSPTLLLSHPGLGPAMAELTTLHIHYKRWTIQDNIYATLKFFSRPGLNCCCETENICGALPEDWLPQLMFYPWQTPQTRIRILRETSSSCLLLFFQTNKHKMPIKVHWAIHLVLEHQEPPSIPGYIQQDNIYMTKQTIFFSTFFRIF